MVQHNAAACVWVLALFGLLTTFWLRSKMLILGSVSGWVLLSSGPIWVECLFFWKLVYACQVQADFMDLLQIFGPLAQGLNRSWYYECNFKICSRSFCCVARMDQDLKSYINRLGRVQMWLTGQESFVGWQQVQVDKSGPVAGLHKEMFLQVLWFLLTKSAILAMVYLARTWCEKWIWSIRFAFW